MLFKDLLDLKYDANTGVINRSAIVDALPDTPELIAFDLYSDHGRKTDFQSLYGDLCISAITWSLTPDTAGTICTASMNSRFQQWFANVKGRLGYFETDGWSCIDAREEVVKHWSDKRTWIKPPILVDKSLVDLGQRLHLVEGHTRVGILAGLLEIDAEAPERTHEIWTGASVPSEPKKTDLIKS